jgi:hypothetical protein
VGETRRGGKLEQYARGKDMVAWEWRMGLFGDQLANVCQHVSRGFPAYYTGPQRAAQIVMDLFNI